MAIPDVSERSISDLLSLKGRVAVVTGGAAGIGYAISDRLAEAGAHVLIGDLNISAAVELGSQNIRVLALAPTLSNTPGVDEKRQWLDERGLSGILEEYAAKLPLGRAGAPNDIARVALFC
jgi:NAD(P)-dependent dehydrogenase (short-subunit alcohol dehydrogenase family)